jgi:hypothetical protein
VDEVLLAEQEGQRRKSEYRISKSETNSKLKSQMIETKCAARVTLVKDCWSCVHDCLVFFSVPLCLRGAFFALDS